LQVPGAICAYHAILAERSGFKAIYLSGGGVAAGSLGLPDLGISNLEDVLTDVRRITDVSTLPLLVDVDTGFGASAFNIARTVRSLIKAGAGAMHIEDQVGAKRCGHRPGKELVSQDEMVDRIKACGRRPHRSGVRDHGAHRRTGGRGIAGSDRPCLPPASRPGPT
jgi:methylisocitrate lyase